MRSVSRVELDAALNFPSLIGKLDEAFAGKTVSPPRHHHDLAHDGSAVHLIMPAWTEGAPGSGAYLGTKLVNIFRDNRAHDLPAVLGTYLLQSGETGQPLAVMDGTRLTHWRTAAASGLAARFLARPDSHHLLMVGAGALAPFLIRAHAAVRPITKVTLWNHRKAGALALAAEMAGSGFELAVADDLQSAVGAADVISCATLSSEPLVRGAWLRPGQHVDLVGAFTFSMRETDDAVFGRARVFVDTEDALDEGGDVAIALRDGVITRDDVQATLHDLCRKEKKGRASPDEITLFKSTGSALEDLAAAILVWERLPKT